MRQYFKRVVLELPAIPIPNIVIARQEIHNLFQDPELRANPEEYKKRRLAVIKEYGVIDEFLEPLLNTECDLQSSLTNVQQQIAELRALKES